MEFEWDEDKHRSNILKHGVGFEMAGQFNWDDAIVEQDGRRDYGENRFIARGRALDGFAYTVAFTFRGPRIRIISMRRFNRKEYERYGA